MSFEWIADQAQFEAAVDDLRGADRYALDTEFHREKTYFPHLALLQVQWDDRLALIDPFAVDLKPFAHVLNGTGLAVLHAGDQDLEVLQLACDAVPSRLFDTQLAAGFLGQSSPSLGNLVERMVGLRLPKGDRLTDWTRRPLTEDQKTYAASDVEHLLELHDKVVAELESVVRLAWAEQECEVMLRRPRLRVEPAKAWWRLKEARQLRGRSRAVAQEVAAWRESRAAATDQPPRYVLPDLALVSIANRPPRSRDELGEVRGIDGRYLKGGAAAELLEAIERGRSLADEDVNVPPTDELDRPLRPAVTLVSAWIAQLAADLSIDAALLATRADLHAFLRKEAGARLAEGWRHDLVGEPVRRLVDGSAALAFDGKGGLALEERSRQPM
ncbi:MAG: ribonuclease [Acidimicrobiaceae bacterium]|nr:ribonuclease [Acidimicrobiaceae bacterium]